jgi:FixJ family two-component response regulator
MTEGGCAVFVVDDDPSVRRGVCRLLRAEGFKAEAFSSARAFLKREPATRPACLLLDVQMPELTGLDLQRALADSGLDLPIIFITGHGSVPISVQAMKAGAVDFLPKPVDRTHLLSAVREALARDAVQTRRASECDEIRRRVESLTAREGEVLALVVAGLLNKQIAAELGTSEKTIKVHRGRVMHKMRAASVAELVRLAEKAGVSTPIR